ncbi:MAG: CD225/dispanin family protein [Duncaniella sp.]|nr:CD225/dispanin family protein [Duncaniella sp.]
MQSSTFYIVQNGTRIGPLSFEQLKEYQITPDTFVWQPGMPEWQRASTCPELTPLFNVPPQFSRSAEVSTSVPPAPRPKTWLVESILTTIFCCLPFGIVGIVKANEVEAAYNRGDLAEAQRQSRLAKLWVLWGVGIAVVCTLLYILFVVVLAVSSGSFSGD